jgi:hypothetical protein
LRADDGRPELEHLEVVLDWPLPASVVEGRGSALFCLGRCLHPEAPIEELAVVLDGVAIARPRSACPGPTPYAPATRAPTRTGTRWPAASGR